MHRGALPLLGIFICALNGCATLPQTGAQTTGEPLRVYTGTVTQRYQVNEKVGEVQHRDSTGRTVGTSAVYAQRTETRDIPVWHGLQGPARVDDEDFFRIGGDQEAADKVRSSRERGVLMNRIGLGILIAGAAAAASGYAMRSNDPNASNGASTALTYGGLIAIPVGGILTWIGLAGAKREHPIDDPARAMDIANRYNGSHGYSAP